MEVFANEGNVSQDANFRAHLDNNWNSGNREFDKIEGLLNTLEENLNGYQDELDQLKRSFNNLKEQHTNDFDDLTKQINELNETIEKQDARISKLEDAVFGYGEYETNYETPKTTDHVFEINTDSNPKLKGE